MWFRILSLVIAAALLGKATIALSMPGASTRNVSASTHRRRHRPRYWSFRRNRRPALAAWYAAIFHYKPWGGVVTASLTALACLSIHQLFRWETHRHRMRKVVANPNVWRVDCLLLAIGALFVALAVFVD